MGKYDVVLVNMPFSPIDTPSLGIGLLVAGAKQKQISIKSTFPGLRLAKILGTSTYFTLFRHWIFRKTMFGDWLFASSIYPENEENEQNYLKYLNKINGFCEAFHDITGFEISLPGETVDSTGMLSLRQTCKQFLEEEVTKILVLNPKIVACSSSFAQHVASLALLKKLKEKSPDIITMMGGANCEGRMGIETIKCFNWLDYLFSGESDEDFPMVCSTLLKENRYLELEETPFSVYSRKKVESNDHCKEVETSIVHDMDKLPIPDFDDFYAEQEESNVVNMKNRGAFVQYSRGCQKGESAPCAFCGLNGTRHSYRYKSPERYFNELDVLTEKHKIKVFILTDSMVGFNAYNGWLKDSKKEQKYSYFVEIISTLSEEKVKSLADAGVFYVQAGIESLNDNVLKQLKKGNSAIRNIALLKYLLEEFIIVHWNFLINVPGERVEDYREMADLIPLVEHLPPPAALETILYCRFSTYYNNPEKYGIELRPVSGYSYIYQEQEKSINNLAYYFYNKSREEDFNYSEGQTLFVKRLRHWQKFSRFGGIKNNKGNLSVLQMVEKEGTVFITDTRECAVSTRYILDDLDSEIYRLIRSPAKLSDIEKKLAEKEKFKNKKGKAQEGLNYLIEKKLAIKIKNSYLALAVFPTKKIPPQKEDAYRFFIEYSELFS